MHSELTYRPTRACYALCKTQGVVVGEPHVLGPLQVLVGSVSVTDESENRWRCNYSRRMPTKQVT